MGQGLSRRPSQELPQYLGPTSAEKLRTLQELRPLVLDNSLRETTVAQIRGHTLRDKLMIMDAINLVRFPYVILATFSLDNSPEDEFCRFLKTNNYDFSRSFGFANLQENILSEGTAYDPTPTLGLRKCKEYGIPNVILEIDLSCKRTNWNIFTNQHLVEFMVERIEWVHRNLHQDAKVFFNYRDFPTSCVEAMDRVLEVTSSLAALPTDLRPFGIMFEDPTGGLLPFEIEEWVGAIRAAMNKGDWRDGHLLAHIHKNYELDEAGVLAALSVGATGIWCGVCNEGAATGHASSVVTLTNLARLGNPHVRKMFDLPALRKAAIDVTRIVTGADPHPKTEVYGSRALDVCFDPAAMGGMTASIDGVDLYELLGVEERIRISSMTTAHMFAKRLTQDFGKMDDGSDWDPQVCARMQSLIKQSLAEGVKEEYDSKEGLVHLYKRAGGKVNAKMKVALMFAQFSFAETYGDIKDKRSDSHPLMKVLYEYFKLNAEKASDGSIHMNYTNFYNAFLAKYIPCHVCDMADEAFAAFDLEQTGLVPWSEVHLRAQWALSGFPEDIHTVDDLIGIICSKFIIPEVLGKLRRIGIDDDVTRFQRRREVMNSTGSILALQSMLSPEKKPKSHGPIKKFLSMRNLDAENIPKKSVAPATQPMNAKPFVPPGLKSQGSLAMLLPGGATFSKGYGDDGIEEIFVESSPSGSVSSKSLLSAPDTPNPRFRITAPLKS